MNRVGLFFISCALASCAPFFPASAKHGVFRSSEFPGWSQAPLGRAVVTSVALGDRDAKFARDFPGQIGAFVDDRGRNLIVRWVAQPTRQLHPASDCLRALGYAVQPGPIWVESDGTRWGSVLAVRAGVRLRVRERICDQQGAAWTDVSAWYWPAVFGRSRGPWWSITVLEPAME